jgi:hypothetical protein
VPATWTAAVRATQTAAAPATQTAAAPAAMTTTMSPLSLTRRCRNEK